MTMVATVVSRSHLPITIPENETGEVLEYGYVRTLVYGLPLNALRQGTTFRPACFPSSFFNGGQHGYHQN